MTSITAYSNISQTEIKTQRITSDGKGYSLNHPAELVVPMRYIGTNKSNSNSQGWERNHSYYFKELQNRHPEYFSKKNAARIEQGAAPKVDAKFASCFPQYKGYENEPLIHHHIGRDGQAVAVPSSIHKGYGEIHAVENELGVTDNALKYSKQCEQLCIKDPSCIGKTSKEFDYILQHNLTSEKNNSVSNSKSAQTQTKAQAAEHKDNAISRIAQTGNATQTSNGYSMNAIRKANQSKSENADAQQQVSELKHSHDIRKY